MIRVLAFKPALASVQVIVSCVVPLAKPQVEVDPPPVQSTAFSLLKKLDGVVRITLPPLGTALTVVNPNANQPTGFAT